MVKEQNIYDEYQKTKINEFGGKLIQNHFVYLECGMEMKMYLKKTKNGERELVKQVTVRDIKIKPIFQKKGLFTEFVRRILEEKQIAICLESVQPDWLKKKLENSNLWVLQSDEETKDFCPTYVRFPIKDPIHGEAPEFSLF